MSAPLFRHFILSTSLVVFTIPAMAASWVQLAHDRLEAKLSAQYPEVSAWSLLPLLGKRQPDVAEDTRDVAIETMKLGKRSAVQVSWSSPARRETLWFTVTGEVSALAVTQDVRALEPVTAAMTALETNAPWDPDCSVVAELGGKPAMRARKPLRSGAVLCADNIEAKPPVSRGEAITVHSVAGMVAVDTTGIAESDAAMGQVLRVKNPSNGELYEALVSGEGEVLVH